MNPEFPLEPELIYLNHAGVSPWPLRTAEAVRRFAVENLGSGALRYSDWLEVETSLRESIARLINAPSKEDISLLKNTSEGLSLVAYGIPWKRNDNIVSIAQEFPSNRIVWESLARRGLGLRLLDLDSAGPDFEQDLMNLCDERTRLLAISSVQYARGLKLDLERLGSFCSREGILFCIDAIQSIGAEPFDVQSCNADFVTADGHKWMLGPEGLAMFYCRAELRQDLRLHEFGWHMVEDAWNFAPRDWKPAGDATRFECGSPNMLGIHALHASLSLLHETGMEEIADRIRHNVQTIIDHSHSRGYHLLTPEDPARRSGIVTFGVPDRDPKEIHRRIGDRGVLCACRGGGIRFSPHFYTERQQIEQAFSILDEALS